MIDVTAVLGWEKELGQKVSRRMDFDALIKKGMPWGVVSHIKKAFNLPDEVLAGIIGISPRTMARRRQTVKAPAKSASAVSGKPRKGSPGVIAAEMLSPVESDRIYRFARVVALAEDVFEDKKDALMWLNTPQHGLGGCIPFSMLQTDAGSREVEELLNRIDYGVIS